MTMPIEPIYLIPETSLLPDAQRQFASADDMSMFERASSMCRTAKHLEEMGATFTFTDEDKEAAFSLVQAYAGDPQGTSKEVTPYRAEELPESLVIAGGILREFGQLVVRDSERIRNLVTNKLIIESDHPDARIRLRAIEMLGKLSDVGAFTEKSIITHRDETSDNLKQQLKEQLLAMRAERKEREIEGDYEVVQPKLINE